MENTSERGETHSPQVAKGSNVRGWKVINKESQVSPSVCVCAALHHFCKIRKSAHIIYDLQVHNNNHFIQRERDGLEILSSIKRRRKMLPSLYSNVNDCVEKVPCAP